MGKLEFQLRTDSRHCFFQQSYCFLWENSHNAHIKNLDGNQWLPEIIKECHFVLWFEIFFSQKETNSPKRTRWQEIIKLRAEINKIKTKKTIKRINETKKWFFEKIKKIEQPLSKLTTRQRGNIQINKVRDEKGVINCAIVVHTFNLSTREAKADRSLRG